MAQAIITLTDESGQINVKVDFGEGGMDEDSNAHHAAIEMLAQYLNVSMA